MLLLPVAADPLSERAVRIGGGGGFLYLASRRGSVAFLAGLATSRRRAGVAGLGLREEAGLVLAAATEAGGVAPASHASMEPATPASEGAGSRAGGRGCGRPRRPPRQNGETA